MIDFPACRFVMCKRIAHILKLSQRNCSGNLRFDFFRFFYCTKHTFFSWCIYDLCTKSTHQCLFFCRKFCRNYKYNMIPLIQCRKCNSKSRVSCCCLYDSIPRLQHSFLFCIFNHILSGSVFHTSRRIGKL